MNVGIDVTSVVNQRAGIARYTRNLVLNLLKSDQENNYLLYSFFGNDQQKLAPLINIPATVNNANCDFRLFDYHAQKLKTLLFLLRLIHKTPESMIKEADIFHSPDFMWPASAKKPSLITIQDLIFLKFPEFFTCRNRTNMRSLARFSTKNANAIICTSNSSKIDVIELLKVKEEKIFVVPLGVDEAFQPCSAQKVEEARKKYNLPQKYILTVGTIEPRKNLKRLLQAFLELKKDKDFEHKLVIAGEKGWRYKDFFNELNKQRITEEVIITGHIDDRDLPAIYSGASVFVYPSLYEGFGLPPLEAMACGTPVVCSDTSSLPEVVGGAAFLANPLEPGTIAASIKIFLDNEGLAREFSQKGIEQAKKFTWEQTARQTLEIYNTLRN